MNSFDLMIEKYSKELIETGKKSIMSAVEEVIEKENSEVVNAKEDYVAASGIVDDDIKDGVSVYEKNRQNKSIEEADEGSGRLKIQTFAADGVYPVVAANVRVFKKGENVPYFEGYTDGNGIIDNIILPAPQGVDTDLPPEIEPFFNYDIEIIHPKFITKKYINVPIFDNINSIQTVRLIPKEQGFDEDNEVVESENKNLMKRDDN